jgi:hypothetical protein
MLIVALIVLTVGLLAAFLVARGPERVDFPPRRPRPAGDYGWSEGCRSLVIAGRVARLKERTKNHPDTVLSVGDPDLQGGDLRLFESGRKRPGDEDRLVGEPEFDRAWAVQGADVPRFFSAEARADILAAVTALRRFKRPRVRVGPEGLELRVKCSLGDASDRRAFFHAAEVFLEVMRGRAEPALIWIESRDGGPVLCQVCGSDILSRAVLCRACRTPHHEECWTYAGRCSTYGCGQRSFVRV